MSEEKNPTRKRLRRFDIKKLLANPELRKNLIVRSTVATQAREGIDISEKQAETSYYVVTEGERAAFFGLVPFRSEAGENDGRHVEFVSALYDQISPTRTDIALRDFDPIDNAPLSFSRLALVGPLFRSFPPLYPSRGETRIGHQTFNDERFVRHWWEVLPGERGPGQKWVPFAKGGSFSRFYSDVYLVVRWDSVAHESYSTRKSNFNVLLTSSAPDFLHREALTWPRRTNKGFNIRRMPPGCIFGDKGPALFPAEGVNMWFLAGVLNSSLPEYLMGTLTSYSWESGVVQKVPIPKTGFKGKIEALALAVHDVKSNWDTGNEICTRFDRPWALQTVINGKAASLSSALDAVLDHEAALDDQLQSTYAELNDAVYRLYGVNDALRAKIEAAIGSRPPEIVWPQMEGRDRDQKRREHVDRLLCYLVKRVVEADEDGIVCLQRVFHEPPLIERLRRELAACFPEQDPNALETEVVNELKKKTKGYRRAESLTEWLHDAFFEIHNALYLQRPLLWHLASNQVRTEPGFACLVHAHRFTAEGLAKLRSVYLRDRITTLRREAAQAGQDNKEAERLELLALAEEVEEYDAKLKLLQEGAHTGTEGGDRDYRILTPWKSPADRPQGWNPDLDDGIKVNLAPLARTNLLRRKLKLGEAKEED
jgi:hypothetical protein